MSEQLTWLLKLSFTAAGLWSLVQQGRSRGWL
jgi:hypothetical protein